MFQTPFSTWDPKWSPTEHEIFRDFGFAAFTVQMLESALVTVLLVGEDAGLIEVKKPKKKRDLESELYLSEQTLGKLICLLKEGGISDNLIEMIDDALKARNYLMHHFFVWNAENYTTEEGRARMLKELQELRFLIGRAQLAFDQIREKFIEQIYGYTAEDVNRLYEKFKEEQG